MRIQSLCMVVGCLWGVVSASAQENFRKLVGDVGVQDVAPSKTLQVPYITWGGDVATFLANGELKTKAGSTYQA
ncbi:MAG: hypothetical protein ACK53L_27050, partial [Pirellulaceae bacterium]